MEINIKEELKDLSNNIIKPSRPALSLVAKKALEYIESLEAKLKDKDEV